MTAANQACWDIRPTSPPTAEQPKSAAMDAAVKMTKRPRGSRVRNAISDHAPNPIATIRTTRCMRSTIIDRSLRCHCHPEPGPRLAHVSHRFFHTRLFRQRLKQSLRIGTGSHPKNICGFTQRCPLRVCHKRIESLPMVGGGLEYSAPFQRAIELIGKRWTGAVVKALIPAPARFNQLLAGIPGISDRVLTERLRELEAEAIVERLVDPGPPVRVSYRLTSRGHALQPVLAAVSDWDESWLDAPTAAGG